MSSFRLRTYFTRSFQRSVSILTNVLAFFLHHLLKIRMIPSPVKHKQTKHNWQIHSHLKKVHVSRFQVVSNEAIQDLNSVAVNKHTKSFDLLNKTMNERTSSEASASPDPASLTWWLLYFQGITVHVSSVTVRPLSLFTIKMANIWQIRLALHGAQWRVPTNFILYVSTLMFLLLSDYWFVLDQIPHLRKLLLTLGMSRFAEFGSRYFRQNKIVKPLKYRGKMKLLHVKHSDC